MTYYAILPIEKINEPDWSQLDQDRDSARRSNTGNLLLVSFLKAYKEEFEDITGLETFNNPQIMVLLNSSDWVSGDDFE